MHIDDKRVNVLTKLVKTKMGKRKHTKNMESDHNLIETKLNIPWCISADEPTEVFNLKDKVSQERFFALTNKTTDLSKIFETNKTLEVQTKKFIKRLDGFIHQRFQKIKITTKCDQRLEEL